MSRPAGHPDNSLISGLANDARWSRVDDRAAETAKARKAASDRFLTQAREQYPHLDESELARRAEYLRSAHFKRMALKSAQARRKNKPITHADMAQSDGAA